MKASEDTDHKIARFYRLMENQTRKQRSPILTLIHQKSWQEFWLTKTKKALYLPTEFNRIGFIFEASVRYHDVNMHQRV